MIKRLRTYWDQFFFAPFDLELAAVLRVGYATLLIANLLVLGLDLEFFFGPNGVMPLAASRNIIDPTSRTIFELLPDTNLVTWICFLLMLAHAVGLLVGWFPRVQAFGVFLWLWWFHDRHVMIFDGEDQMFRLFAFFFIFLPSHHFHSVHAWLRKRRDQPPYSRYGEAWALRLFQIQMTFVYFGAALSKWRGSEWRDGIAMWYVTRLDDAFGRFPLPDFLFNSLTFLRLLTWSTLVVEISIPFLLWLPKTRKVGLVVALLFHLALEYCMNLFLFHPLMIVGLISFLATTPKHRDARHESASFVG